HRDLKPGNVLVAPRPGAPIPSRLERPPGGYVGLEVKLTDFGLASIVEAQETVDAGPFAGGTPAYMAPEQFESRWRDYGPWTDLYGVGCLIWSMVKGLPPFGTTTTVEEKRHQHLNELPPPLEPPVAVPDGLEGWLRTLLEKDPARRFRRAADALSALRALGPPITLPTSTPSLPPSAVPTLVFGEQPTEIDGVSENLEIERVTGSNLAIAAGGVHVPPIPAEWRSPDDASPRHSLPSSGLGLFGLRTPPLVDRNAEREALWQALRRTDREKTVRAVVLTGPGGSGKSRLAEWLCQRAHETGAAQIMKAVHSPIPGPAHGLGPMLRATLRCQGLDRVRLRDRVEEIFASRGVGRPDEWDALTEVIEPSSQDAQVPIRFTTPTERYVTIRRLLQAMTAERPLVLWLDDVHHGLDALRFAVYLLDYAARQPLPILLVLTATDELLEKRKDEGNVLAELLEHERASRLAVEALPATHRSALVRGVLGLDPALARRVEDRTHGNPLFVVQLVGDWVQRGLLRVGAEGFVLHDDEELPSDVSGMWAQRVARMLARRTDEEGHALELAAVLGSEVDPAEWGAACLLAPGAHPSDALLNDLLDQRLVRTGPDGPGSGWTFSHDTLRTALLNRADEAGRLPIWHRACAELLEGEAQRHRRTAMATPSGASSWMERVGRHWLGAGQPERALPWLQEGARERVSTGDYAVAEQLVLLRDEALRDRLGAQACADVQRFEYTAALEVYARGLHDLARRCGTLREDAR
ncbi:MAG: AAA family ATPase, partial [Myxococcales bacterium]|nr:AAA family ATPase [Myxococcales bacterium]